MTYKIGQPIKWHKATWDGTLNPIILTVLKGMVLEKRSFGKGRRLALIITKGNNFWLGYDMDDLNRFGGYLVKLWNKNSQLFSKHRKNYFKYLSAVKSLYKKIQKANLNNLSNKELIKLYSTLVDTTAQFVSWSAFCEAATVYLQPFVDQILEKCTKKHPTELCRALVAPSRSSFLQEKELSELKTALKIIQNRKIKKIFGKDAKEIFIYLKSFKSSLKILKSLKSLQSNYYWVNNNYIQSKYLSLNFFIREVKKILKEHDFNPQNIKDAIDKIKSFQKLKNSASRKIKLGNKDRFCLGIVDEITFLQDTRKGIFIESIEYFDRLLKEISRRTKIGEKILKFLLFEEMPYIFNDRKQERLKSLAKKRYTQCAAILKDGKITIEIDREKISKLRKWLCPKIKTVKALKGTTASAGPEITGRCRVILSVSKVNKLKKGEVLVTGNTTPDYVPAMKKAAAVLAEKGGLTSHAAIVSRELGVPCIVGVKDVTRILKTGYIVELDANKGLIKILKDKK